MFDKRLPLKEYLQIVAATNFKQRVRKTMEYYHADRLNYAVIGTPNRLEYDQGFFVKNGDGAGRPEADRAPVQTQVYAMVRHLGCRTRCATRSRPHRHYTLAQGQDEVHFAHAQTCLALWAYSHGRPA